MAARDGARRQQSTSAVASHTTIWRKQTINPQSSDVFYVRRNKQGPGILTRMPARAHFLGRQWGGSTQQQQLTPASRRRGKTPRDPGPTQLMSLPPL